jgi:hypothetical protein
MLGCRHKGLVGVKRVKLDGSDALPGGAFKTLTHRQFQKVQSLPLAAPRACNFLSTLANAWVASR